MLVLLTNIAAILKAQVRRTARRQMASALLGGLALLFLGVAIIAGIAAIGVALATRWGVLAACLIIMAAAFVVAVLLVAVAAMQAREARRRQQAELAEMHHAILAAKAIATDLAQGKALVVASVLGVLVGLMATRREPQDKS
jgi:uncharacterized membrane protein